MTAQDLLHHRFSWEIAPGVAHEDADVAPDVATEN